MYMPDYYWDQNNAVPVDYLCSQWFLRPEWLQYMWVSAGGFGDSTHWIYPFFGKSVRSVDWLTGNGFIWLMLL